jgi:dienelactone hydrolase
MVCCERACGVMRFPARGWIRGKRWCGVCTVSLLLGLVLGGSCAPARLNRQYAGPEEMPADLLAYYSYPKQPIEAKIEIKAQKRQYEVLFIEFPSALNVFSEENIRIDYYAPKKPGRRPTVLMLPISGGVDFSVESFARLFVKHGINCALVHNRRVKVRDTKSAEEVEAYFRQTVLDNRQVLDYLLTRPDVDPNRIGCLGLSLGGIKTSLVAAVDDRIRCAVLGLAGGSMADIALHSREPGLRDYVQELLALGVEPDLIYGELEEKVRTDPLRLAPYLDARNALMFLAGFDRVVPIWTGKQLRQAIGGPRTVYLLAGHYASFLFLPYAHWASLCFVKQKFNLD